MNYELRIKNKGAAMMVAVFLVVFAGTVIALGISSPALGEARLAIELMESRRVAALADSGQEDVGYRVRTGQTYDATEVLSLDGVHATTSSALDATTGTLTITTEANGDDYVRGRSMELVRGSTVTFNYGVQAGQGGLRMENQSLIRGNVYSNGTIVGTQDNYIYGTAVSVGENGLIDGIHATGTSRAHLISDSTIDGDAYYQFLEDTTVLGTLYPGSPDPEEEPLPISDATLDEWQAAAEAGGVISSPCPYIINANVTIGPIKINCDVEVRNGATVTVAGMVWVVGTVEVKNSSIIRLGENVVGNSTAIIADNPANRLTSSKVILRNTIRFYGNTKPNSYVTMVSRNTSAENGGTEKAISFEQTAEGEVLVYSNHGKVFISNNSDLREVTGYIIHLVNSAELIYKQGIAQSIFDTGPGGSWEIYTSQEVE